MYKPRWYKRAKHVKAACSAKKMRRMYLAKSGGDRALAHRKVTGERIWRKTVFHCGHCGAKAVHFTHTEKGTGYWMCLGCHEQSCSWTAVCAPYGEVA